MDPTLPHSLLTPIGSIEYQQFELGNESYFPRYNLKEETFIIALDVHESWPWSICEFELVSGIEVQVVRVSMQGLRVCIGFGSNLLSKKAH